MKHTPGDWEAVCTKRKEADSVQLVRVSRNGEYLPVALCDESLDIPRKEREANARLMAAAPDLLKACQMALAALRTTDYHYTEECEALTSAITKATNPKETP